MKEFDEGFFDTYTDDFYDYFERHRIMKLLKKPEYKIIIKEICNIKNKYPNITKYLEDNEIVELKKEDLRAILKVLELQEKIDYIEQKECFKLGFKEAYIYFESMNMLNI